MEELEQIKQRLMELQQLKLQDLNYDYEAMNKIHYEYDFLNQKLTGIHMLNDIKALESMATQGQE